MHAPPHAPLATAGSVSQIPQRGTKILADRAPSSSTENPLPGKSEEPTPAGRRAPEMRRSR
eukprot:13632732-Alexandrium_andersonii.AAC.1